MKESFGKTLDGVEADLYTLRNVHGLEARITNYGGILVSLMVPDRDGKSSDVVLGFDNLEGYLKEHPCFGALIGRYANRIAGGCVSIEGVGYQLTRNNEGNRRQSRQSMFFQAENPAHGCGSSSCGLLIIQQSAATI